MDAHTLGLFSALATGNGDREIHSSLPHIHMYNSRLVMRDIKLLANVKQQRDKIG